MSSAPQQYSVTNTSHLLVYLTSANREEDSMSGWAAALHALLKLKTASVISGGSMNDILSHSSFTQLTTDCTMVGIVKGELCEGGRGHMQTHKQTDKSWVIIACHTIRRLTVVGKNCIQKTTALERGRERSLLNITLLSSPPPPPPPPPPFPHTWLPKPHPHPNTPAYPLPSLTGPCLDWRKVLNLSSLAWNPSSR